MNKQARWIGISERGLSKAVCMEASPSVGGSAITVWKLDGLGLSGGQLAGRDRR